LAIERCRPRLSTNSALASSVCDFVFDGENPDVVSHLRDNDGAPHLLSA
jgi:hypothetical protein